jgi:hypothetical protein
LRGTEPLLREEKKVRTRGTTGESAKNKPESCGQKREEGGGGETYKTAVREVVGSMVGGRTVR